MYHSPSMKSFESQNILSVRKEALFAGALMAATMVAGFSHIVAEKIKGDAPEVSAPAVKDRWSRCISEVYARVGARSVGKSIEQVNDELNTAAAPCVRLAAEGRQFTPGA